MSMTEDYMLIFAVVQAVLVALTIGLLLVHRQAKSALEDNHKMLEDNRRLLEDNNLLASELVALKNEVEKHQLILDELGGQKAAHDQEAKVQEESKPRRKYTKRFKDPKKMNNEELGEWIDYKVTENNLFCNPELNIRTLALNLGLTQKRIKQLLKDSPRYNRLYEYLTEKRIAYASELIIKNPHWSIDAVSKEVGFVSRTTFQAEFKKRMGVTPAKYRFNNS